MSTLLNLSGPLATIVDLLMVVIGFGLIIFVHELGHFLAARWAGIRVLAFALGFGPALISYRPGLGVRQGSSELEYRKLVRQRGDGRGLLADVSSTEYRLNLLPLGGYVKMLGQDDSDVRAESPEPDSYGNAKPIKRLVVISAGVVMNIIFAAIVFVIVFMAGLKTEAATIGSVRPGAPAATAMPAAGSVVQEPGLRPLDKIISIDGQSVRSFNDVATIIALASATRPLKIEVERPGVNGRVKFAVTPRLDPDSRLLGIGIGPAASGVLMDSKVSTVREQMKSSLGLEGFPQLEPGMKLTNFASWHELEQAINASDGKPVIAEFAKQGGTAGEGAPTVRVPIEAEPRLQTARLKEGDVFREAVHIAGLSPVIRLTAVTKDSPAMAGGLLAGDVIEQVGSTLWPTMQEFRSAIAGATRTGGNTGAGATSAAAGTVDVVVRREGKPVTLKGLKPDSQGRLGVLLGTSTRYSPIVGRMPSGSVVSIDGLGGKTDESGLLTSPPPSFPSIDGGTFTPLPGMVVTKVEGVEVATLEAFGRGVIEAARGGKRTLEVEFGELAQDGSIVRRSLRKMSLNDEQAQQLASLRFTPAINPGNFELASVVLKDAGPAGAFLSGVRETKLTVQRTYLNLLRLIQGSVKVEHLRGPVGIAHTGTILAERGLLWVLFFMGLISVNLAVINFLPLPIVDGGHVVYIIYEMITKRKVSVNFQAAAALVGLGLIGIMFLVVTYNDLARLFGGM
jgi:regulator of sigma E protease